MDIKNIIKNKKIRNILITIAEIVVVAGIIFAVLMFMYSKINNDADKISGVNNIGDNQETSKNDTALDSYYIQVNIKKNAMIVYQYSADKKTKKPYKIFKCSVGSDVKKGKYKTSVSYSWIDINGSWHKYNTQFDMKSWIQSAGYRDKYGNTLKKDSYRAIGGTQKAGSCIMLYAGDAKWIYDKCSNKTEIEIVKGKKSDKLPLSYQETINPIKYCGWDPTDADKDNPYKKVSSGKIVIGTSVIYVEKGNKPEYMSNILARDESGKNILDKLKYKDISTEKTGTYKVKYSYKTASGKKLQAVQTIKVVDTTPPKVTCSKSLFTFEVDSLDKEDLNKKSNVEKIKSMVRSSVSCNESGTTITVSCMTAQELKEGKIPVIIKAKDSAGNIGSCQVMCEIKVKKVKAPKPKDVKKYINKEKTTKKDKDKTKTKSEKETTKKSK